MTRLPSVGQDDGTWGTILNDFLSVEHNSDGTLKSSGSLATKATDTTVVHNTGNEVVAGTKTFSSSPVVPSPTLGSQAASKTYVDTTVSDLSLGTAATHAHGDYDPAGAAAAVTTSSIGAATAADLTSEATTARAAEALAVPRWQPSTAYALDVQVVSPNNDVVKSNIAHTSAAAFATDVAKWMGSATYAPRDSVYFTARNRPDGALATPLVTDSGTPYTLTHFGGSGFVVAAEALTATAGLPYLNFGPLPSKVREITMTVKWTDAAQAADAPAVMIVSDGTFHVTDDASVYANAGGHILIFRDHVNVMKRKADGTGTGTYYSKFYPKALSFDVWHTFTARWDGKQVIFSLPDGTSYEAGPDAEVQAWWGRYACVEIVANVPTANPVTIADFNVTSRIRPSSNAPSRRNGRLLYRHETSGANITTAIIAATTTCFATAALVPVPASKRILVEGGVWIEELGPLAQTAASLFLTIQYGSSSFAKNLTVISGYTPISDGVTPRAHGRQVPFSVVIDLSAFVPGEQYAVTVKAVASAVGLFNFIDSGSASGGASTLRTSWLNVYETTS